MKNVGSDSVVRRRLGLSVCIGLIVAFLAAAGLAGCNLFTLPNTTTTTSTTTTTTLPGTARLTALRISSFTNTKIASFPIDARVLNDTESSRIRQEFYTRPRAVGGSIEATLPGGSGTSIVVEATVTAGGTASAGGAILSGPTTIDLSQVSEILAIDGQGRRYAYTLDIGDSGLPSVFLATKDGVPITSKEEDVEATVSIAGGSTGYATPLAATAVTVRGRGNSTWYDPPKKPYRIKFSSSTALFDMPAAKKWVLLANYMDNSLLRTSAVYSVVPEIFGALPWTPKMRFVELYLNGQYNGSYLLGEQVEVGSTRLNIGTPTTAADTSYLVEINRWITMARFPGEVAGVEGVDYFVTDLSKTHLPKVVVEYKSPEPGTSGSALNDTQRTYIKGLFDTGEAALYAGTTSTIEAAFDTASIVDWLLVQEFFKNTDSAFVSSVYMHRRPGGKLVMGPLWDFDLCAGNADPTEAGTGDGTYMLNDPRGWFAAGSVWMQKFLAVPEFKSAVVARWNAVKTELRDETLDAIDDYEELLERSQVENFLRWPVDINAWPKAYPVVHTHAEYVELFRQWIRDRWSWIDANIASLP